MPTLLFMGLGSKGTSSRLHMPRNAQRFETNTLSCPLGTVRDVSETGFRLSSRKKMDLKKGEIHEIRIRTESKQLAVKARVQWVRRVCWLPAVYEAGFQIMDPRPGVGVALRQLGQFGFANKSAPIMGESKASNASSSSGPQSEAGERPQAFIDFENLYEVLGVTSSATGDEIKRAYRKLAQKLHPDHDPSPDAAYKFDRIAKAYAVLGDPRRREWYDKMVAGEIAA